MFLANSMQANCNPKQIPKNGILFILAYLIASILPSIPRWPNPPGTKIPFAFFNNSLTLSLVISPE